jgi:hypothetical protein
MNERLGIGRMRMEESNRTVAFLASGGGMVGGTHKAVCEEEAEGVFFAKAADDWEEAMVAVLDKEQAEERSEGTPLPRALDCMVVNVSN